MEPTPFDPSSHQDKVDSAHLTMPKRRRVILIAILSFVIIVLSVVAVYQWNHYRQREALKNQLKKIVLEDNALVQTFLDMDDLSQITYAEYFKRTGKNKDERDELIQRMRTIEAGSFAQQANQFVKLMELENEFIRADENLSRQTMKVTTLDDIFVDANKTENDAQHELSVTTDQYYNAAYGNDYSERFAMELAKSKVDQARKGTVEALKRFEEERKKIISDTKEALLVLQDWMKVEKQWYPQFAPPRDIADELIKKKAKYQSRDGSETTDTKGAAHDGVSSMLIVPGFEFEGYQDVLTWLSRPSEIIIHGQGTRVLPVAGGDLYADSTKLSIILSD